MTIDKPVKKIFFSVLLLLIAMILALQIDDDLHPEVLAFLDKANTETKDSEAYYYLMGMFAAADEDPAEVGRNLYQSIRKAEEDYLVTQEPFDFDDYPGEKKLDSPEGDMFCKSWEPDCLTSLFRKREDIEMLLRKSQVLLKRYETFLNFKEYTTLSRPTYPEPLPEYQYLFKANRLFVLQSIDIAKGVNKHKALSMLSHNIERLRRQLAFQDTMIGKLFILIMLSENIDIAYTLSKTAEKGDLFKIPPLSLEERSFEVVMAREFSMLFYEYIKIRHSSEPWTQNSKIPRWLEQSFFKPNIVLNAIFPRYTRTVEYSKLSHEQFVFSIENHKPIQIESSSFRNSLGDVLLRVRPPNYPAYLARLFDLDAKIRLYNALAGKMDVEAHLFEVINPYYPNVKSISFSKDGSKVCFDGPLPDTRNLRCLPENIVNTDIQP